LLRGEVVSGNKHSLLKNFETFSELEVSHLVIVEFVEESAVAGDGQISF